MKKIKEIILLLLFCFAIGFLAHMGTNTAKLIWPYPPIQYEIVIAE